MDVCYECNKDTIKDLKNEINLCLMKVSASIFDDLHKEKNEHKIKKILVKMLVETCEFIISQNCLNEKKTKCIKNTL